MGGKSIEEVKDFLDNVDEKFHPELMILFGSRARGEHLKSSDYDFIIVSNKFSGIHFLDRIYQVLKLWNYDWDVDILAYTPEEFQEKKSKIGIVKEAVKEGLVIK